MLLYASLKIMKNILEILRVSSFYFDINKCSDWPYSFKQADWK